MVEQLFPLNFCAVFQIVSNLEESRKSIATKAYILINITSFFVLADNISDKELECRLTVLPGEK